MNVGTDRAVDGIRAAVREARSEDVRFMAGNIAYHAFVSLIPVLVLLTLVVSLVGTEPMANRIVRAVASYFPESVRGVLTDSVTSGGATHVTLFSAVALVWGSFKIFRSLDAAFAEIYDTERRASLSGQLTETAVVLVAVLLSVVALGVTATVISFPRWLPFAGILNQLVSVVVLVVAFLPMYYVFPNVSVSLREVLPGTVVAALGWTAIELVFRLYAAFSTGRGAYGLAGGVLLLVVWLYFGGLVLLAGASVNATLAGRDDGEQTDARRLPERVENERQLAAGLDRLVSEARRNGVSEETIRSALARRAGRVEERDGREK